MRISMGAFIPAAPFRQSRPGHRADRQRVQALLTDKHYPWGVYASTGQAWNKRSTDYDFRQQFSRAACGRNGRGADRAPPWRRPAAETARGGRATAAPGSRNREYHFAEQGTFAREQGSFCMRAGKFLRKLRPFIGG